MNKNERHDLLSLFLSIIDDAMFQCFRIDLFRHLVEVEGHRLRLKSKVEN